MPSVEIAPAVTPFHCVVHSLSETGPVRTHNEDSIAFSFLDTQQRHVLAVLADGMGGHNAGEVASNMACEYILKYVLKNEDNNFPEVVLKQAFQEAHSVIRDAGNRYEAQKGMGTTATALLIRDGYMYFSHVGDSRLYGYREKRLTQYTKDHTLVNQMYEQGELSKDERDTHKMKNVLLQALGTTPKITPQHTIDGFPVAVDDKYLLCSDGVYDVCSDAELQSFMSMDNPSFALECLRCVAMSRNASDNFSAIIISFSTEPLPVAVVTREQNILP